MCIKDVCSGAVLLIVTEGGGDCRIAEQRVQRLKEDVLRVPPQRIEGKRCSDCLSPGSRCVDYLGVDLGRDFRGNADIAQARSYVVRGNDAFTDVGFGTVLDSVRGNQAAGRQRRARSELASARRDGLAEELCGEFSRLEGRDGHVAVGGRNVRVMDIRRGSAADIVPRDSPRHADGIRIAEWIGAGSLGRAGQLDRSLDRWVICRRDRHTAASPHCALCSAVVDAGLGEAGNEIRSQDSAGAHSRRTQQRPDRRLGDVAHGGLDLRVARG